MFDASTVANQAVQGVLQRIDALAAKIGTTAEHVWDIYVSQARVEAIRDTFTAVALLSLIFVLQKLIKYAMSKIPDAYDEVGWYILIVFSCLSEFSGF